MPILPLLAGTLAVGLIGGAWLIKDSAPVLDATRLVPASQLKPGVASSGPTFLASRRAVQAEQKEYSVEGVLKRLTEPSAKAYTFQKSVYLPALAEEDAAGDEEPAEEDAAGDEEPAEEDAAGDEEPEAEEEVDWADADTAEDGGDDIPMWVAEQKAEDDVEFLDLIFYSFPLMFLFIGLLLYVEITAVLWRRQRDLLSEEGLEKAPRGSAEDMDSRMLLARESHRMIFRPHMVVLSSAGIFLICAAGIDVFNKCFWNWSCFWNLDCNVRILTPAIAECVVDVAIPAAVVTVAVVAFLVGACWSCTRVYAAGVLGVVVLTGIIAIASASLFACFLWLCFSLLGLLFYFNILPDLPDSPWWCQDLGSLSISSDPHSGEIKDGDSHQDWSESLHGAPSPSTEALGVLDWVERTSLYIADFSQRHLRGVRTLWNGCAMRGMVNVLAGNRVRVFGKDHIMHLGSADRVLLVSNHRTNWDMWIITVLGLWKWSGAPVFSFYPVRSTWYYSNFLGILTNYVFSGMAMFPPILNTPSDQAVHESRHNAKVWNDYAVQRIVSELKMPGSVCGVFPEGTRNHSEDLHNILPCKGGVGKIALEVGKVHVIPVFIHGVEDSFWDLIKFNFTDAARKPIDVVFGAHVDVSEIAARAGPDGTFTEAQELAAATRITDALRALAKDHPALVTGGGVGAPGYQYQESPL